MLVDNYSTSRKLNISRKKYYLLIFQTTCNGGLFSFTDQWWNLQFRDVQDREQYILSFFRQVTCNWLHFGMYQIWRLLVTVTFEFCCVPFVTLSLPYTISELEVISDRPLWALLCTICDLYHVPFQSWRLLVTVPFELCHVPYGTFAMYHFRTGG